jgi:hypothetical protein
MPFGLMFALGCGNSPQHARFGPACIVLVSVVKLHYHSARTFNLSPGLVFLFSRPGRLAWLSCITDVRLAWASYFGRLSVHFHWLCSCVSVLDGHLRRCFPPWFVILFLVRAVVLNIFGGHITSSLPFVCMGIGIGCVFEG